mgnify:CR=1 FL=1
MEHISRKEAFELLKKYNKDPFHIQHALTVEAVMKWYANELGYGDDAQYWGIVGLLHDIDFELYPEQHCIKAPELLREGGVSEDIIHGVVSHGYGITVDVAPEHEMEKVLFAADELTGLIWAAALMRPSKSTKDMELKSLKKKYKSKGFAAGCSREVIERGAKQLGWELDTLLERTLGAMKRCEPEIAAAVAAKKEKESRQGGLDLAAARRTPSYWLLWIGLAISSFPGVAFRFYNGAFFRGPIGLDTVTYSNWASVLSVCIAAGMILMGVMADKLGSVKMVVLMHVVSIVGYACAIVLMNNTGSFALLLVTVILCGMNGPLDNATAPYLIPEAFGRKYYDEIIGSYAGAMMIGNVCVPMLLGGIISDGTAASFGLAWKIIIGFGAAAMVILLVGLFKGPYRKQYLALRAEEKQQKALGTAEE